MNADVQVELRVLVTILFKSLLYSMQSTWWLDFGLLNACSTLGLWELSVSTLISNFGKLEDITMHARETVALCDLFSPQHGTRSQQSIPCMFYFALEQVSKFVPKMCHSSTCIWVHSNFPLRRIHSANSFLKTIPIVAMLSGKLKTENIQAIK